MKQKLDIILEWNNLEIRYRIDLNGFVIFNPKLFFQKCTLLGLNLNSIYTLSNAPLGQVPGGRAENGPPVVFVELPLPCKLDDEEFESEFTGT